jgi:hypothetical protein
MANSKLSSEFRVAWAELRFPPINLWAMASLPLDGLPSKRETTHIHRRQRPGSMRQHDRKQPNALRKLHRRLEALLAVRGGKI